MIYLLIAAAAAAVEPGESAEERAYSSCIMEQAKRLTPSGESEQTVARVSKLLCQSKFDAALRRLHEARISALQKRGVSGTLEESQHMLNELAEDIAVTVVVQERAKANSH
jgi:hypothetical protein